jgi:WD40 repeat protein
VDTSIKLNNPTGNFQVHEGMVTCLDCRDNILVSGGVDKRVNVWDIRMSGGVPLKRISMDDGAVLKVALGSNSIAVSTLKGLYLVDIESGNFTPAVGFADKRMGRYHDLAWGNYATNTLYAAGEDHRVDVYKLKA